MTMEPKWLIQHDTYRVKRLIKTDSFSSGMLTDEDEDCHIFPRRIRRC